MYEGLSKFTLVFILVAGSRISPRSRREKHQMKIMRLLAITLSLAVLSVIADNSPAAAQSAKRSITKIADVYRFQNNFHFSVFMVTSDGVLATDPINADAAGWLKAEIAKRFNQPLKYLVYSHDHADHISGGEVFADSATVVAHVKAKEHIIGENRPTAIPDITFSDRLDLTLGGKTVELHYLGLGHGDNMIVMRFPGNVLFVVDVVSPGTVAFRDFPGGYLEQWIDYLRKIEALDFDILAPGHGRMGTKADIIAFRTFMQELRAEVLGHMRVGKNLDEIKQLVTMPKYKSWGQYDNWFKLNVAGMYRHLQLYRRPN